jgi:hypothetical protein
MNLEERLLTHDLAKKMQVTSLEFPTADGTLEILNELSDALKGKNLYGLDATIYGTLATNIALRQMRMGNFGTGKRILDEAYNRTRAGVPAVHRGLFIYYQEKAKDTHGLSHLSMRFQQGAHAAGYCLSYIPPLRWGIMLSHREENESFFSQEKAQFGALGRYFLGELYQLPVFVTGIMGLDALYHGRLAEGTVASGLCAGLVLAKRAWDRHAEERTLGDVPRPKLLTCNNLSSHQYHRT